MEDKTKAVIAILLNKYLHDNKQYWTAFNVQYADLDGIKTALDFAEMDKHLSQIGREWIDEIRKGLNL